ncbi:MAG: hypothetical protein ACFFCQ_14900 [Promethearchaeota archaeon]
MLGRLHTQPSQKYVKIGTLIAIGFFMVFYILMRVVSADIDSSYDVFDLEFAWTTEKIDKILTDWGQDSVDKMILATWIDFGFLLAYGTSLAGLSLLVARRYNEEEKARNIGYTSVVGSYLASGFDALENVNLLIILYPFPNSYPDFAPLLASISAVVKFTLVILTIIYIIIGFLFQLFRKNE